MHQDSDTYKFIDSNYKMPLKQYNRLQLSLFKHFNIKHGTLIYYKLCSIYSMFRCYKLKYSVLKCLILVTREELNYQREEIKRVAYLKYKSCSEGDYNDWLKAEKYFIHYYYKEEIEMYIEDEIINSEILGL